LLEKLVEKYFFWSFFMLREFCSRLVISIVHQLLFYESTDILMRNKRARKWKYCGIFTYFTGSILHVNLYADDLVEIAFSQQTIAITARNDCLNLKINGNRLEKMKCLLQRQNFFVLNFSHKIFLFSFLQYYFSYITIFMIFMILKQRSIIIF